MRIRLALHFFLSTSNKFDMCRRCLTSSACAAHMRWRRSRGSASTSRTCAAAQCWAGCTWQSTAACRSGTSKQGTQQSGNLDIWQRECLLSADEKSEKTVCPSKKDSRWKKICPGNPGCLVGIPKLASVVAQLSCLHCTVEILEKFVYMRLKHRSDFSANSNLINVMTGTIERGVLPSTVLSRKGK